MVAPKEQWHSLFDTARPKRRFALESSVRGEGGRCITVASQKGGVGKTTTVVNLGAGLGLAERKVLVMDLDPQGNATSGLGLEKVGDGRPPPFEAEEDVGSFMSRITETRFENLWVFPSFEALSRAEWVDGVKNTYFAQWKSALGALRKRFDFILVDCPPSLGGLPSLVLSVSDSVIIPVQCEYYAMEGLSQILPVVEELQGTRNPDLRIAGLVLTMYSNDLELSREVRSEVGGYFPELVYGAAIPRDVTLAEASSHGLPVFYYDFGSRGAWSYLNLTREVIEDEGTEAR